CRGEIVKKKSHQIEHGGRLENYRILAGRQFPRTRGKPRLLACSLRQRLWINATHIRRVPFGPARRSFLLHRDGEFGARLPVSRKKSKRVSHCSLHLTAYEDSRCDLPLFHRQIASSSNGARSVRRAQLRSRFHKSLYALITLLPGHWQQMRRFRLALPK